MTTVQFRFDNPPPSLNNSKMPVRRGGKSYMVSSSEYVAWQKSAENQLLTQPSNFVFGYWRSDILIPHGKTKADIDNLIKAIHDILIKNNRVPDDKYLVDLRVRLYPGNNVVVTIKPEGIQKWDYLKRISKSKLKHLGKLLIYLQKN